MSDPMHREAIERRTFAGVFTPTKSNSKDTDGTRFVMIRPPRWAGDILLAHRENLPDDIRSFTFDGSLFTEVTPQSEAEIAQARRVANMKPVAAVPVDAVADCKAPAAAAAASARVPYKVVESNVHIHAKLGPLSDLIFTDRYNCKSIKERTTERLVRDMLFRATHSAIRAEERGDLKGSAFKSRPSALSFMLDEHGLFSASPDYIAGVLSAFSCLMSEGVCDTARITPRPIESTEHVGPSLSGEDLAREIVLEKALVNLLKASRTHKRNDEASRAAPMKDG